MPGAFVRELHVNLGNRYVGVGRWEDAVAAFERAMRFDPRNPDAPTYAAFTLLRLRRDEQAMRAFDRAIAFMVERHGKRRPARRARATTATTR